MEDDDVAAVVIDNGSYKIKAGFAGDDSHRSVFLDRSWTAWSPNISGHCFMPATRRLDFGGRDLTLNLQKLLHEKGYDFVNNSELEIVREMKEKLCYVALDCEQEAGNVRYEKFELPDGNTITISKERFMCPEALFRPIPVVGSGGIVDLLQSSLDATDIDCKKDLLCNIILSGATTMFPGFSERIRKGMESFVPRTTKTKVIANPERKSSVWIGGSILGSLSTFQTYWITKQEYEEYGPTIVHRRD